MSSTPLTVTHTGSIVHVTLNRPDVHNAFNNEMIDALANTFDGLGSDPSVRVIVLAGSGRSFCAGADLNWMKSMVDYDRWQNEAGARHLSAMFDVINTSPKPVVGRVQGAAIGGGCGLVAVCDIVVAGPRARFGLSEVRLGLAPAVISPYVVRKIGSSRARQLFLTGERIRPEQAYEYSLVHRVVDDEDELGNAVDEVVQMLLMGGPEAMAACKELAREADQPEWRPETGRTAGVIARLRVSAEGQEGMRAFLERRNADWLPSAGKVHQPE